MIEYEVDVDIRCDGCGKDLNDGERLYCCECAKRNGIKVGKIDGRSLAEILGAEKTWIAAVNSVKKENGNVNL
jgi:hypothetical protein